MLPYMSFFDSQGHASRADLDGNIATSDVACGRDQFAHRPTAPGAEIERRALNAVE